jgi:hypothetical protein
MEIGYETGMSLNWPYVFEICSNSDVPYDFMGQFYICFKSICEREVLIFYQHKYTFWALVDIVLNLLFLV